MEFRGNVTIVGQGYVGLPLAEACSDAGWKVFGLDRSEAVVSGLLAGTSHVDDLSNSSIKTMLANGYTPTTEDGVIAESRVVIICVPTPLDTDQRPDLTSVRRALEVIGRHMAEGTLVVLESTTYPGTTERLAVPILETASGMTSMNDFNVAFSPERVDPGRTDYGIKNTPKLVGGVDERATIAAVDFYQTFVHDVVAMRGSREAETAKLLENTFRHVNIALVNEMAKFCHELDIDIWDVIRGASTKPFGFMAFTPSAGVGGHCIPIDPNYLSYEVRRVLGYPFRFVELAQEINNSMPAYVVQRSQDLLNEEGKAVRGSNVLLLGVTYKPDIADQRESPAVPLLAALRKKGARVSFHDPLVSRWEVTPQVLLVVPDLMQAVERADLVIMLQDHRSYCAGDIADRAKLLLDTRGGAPLHHQRL